MDLQIGVRTVGDVTILDVVGEVDLYTAPRLDEGLRKATSAPRPRLVVNLSGTAYVDSTALKVLADHEKRVRERQGAIALIATQPTIAKIFKIAGLSEILPTFPTEQEAVERVRAHPAAT